MGVHYTCTHVASAWYCIRYRDANREHLKCVTYEQCNSRSASASAQFNKPDKSLESYSTEYRTVYLSCQIGSGATLSAQQYKSGDESLCTIGPILSFFYFSYIVVRLFTQISYTICLQ